MVELGINLPLLIAYLVTFVILLAILYQFAYKPLMAAMDQRSERIQEGLFRRRTGAAGGSQFSGGH